MTLPNQLQTGDKVAILSPATVVKPEYIDGAARFLSEAGFRPVIMPHAKGPASGSFAADDDARVSDLTAAYADPSIRAILCARGGYGCNHLLSRIDPALVAADPKWLIGFSDVSALHALSLRAGVVSLHAPMAKHLTELPADHYCTDAMMRILTRGLPVTYRTAAHPLNRLGHAEGILVGGNLAVINGLAATPFDPLSTRDSGTSSCGIERRILFIEDISEKIYAVERMLIRLRLSGALDSLAAIIIGSFTDYTPDRNHPDMYTMISRLLGPDFPAPVTFGFPAGHTDDNLPLPLGAHASLDVADGGVTLTLSDPC